MAGQFHTTNYSSGMTENQPATRGIFPNSSGINAITIGEKQTARLHPKLGYTPKGKGMQQLSMLGSPSGAASDAIPSLSQLKVNLEVKRQ